MKLLLDIFNILCEKVNSALKVGDVFLMRNGE